MSSPLPSCSTGRGREHGHIQCCFLPSLELGQIWQSVVQPFRLRLNVCRIQSSPSEKHHRSFSIMAVSRNRCYTTEWNTTESSPQEQRPLPATKRSIHENTWGQKGLTHDSGNVIMCQCIHLFCMSAVCLHVASLTPTHKTRTHVTKTERTT